MIVELSKAAQSLEYRIRQGVALVDFDTPWCAPCRVQRPIIEELARAYKGKVIVTGFNVDKDRQLALRLDITSVPTLIIFKNGKEIQRFIGVQSDATLSRAIDHALR